MSEHVRIEQDGGVVTLTMARPEKKNALTDGMYKVLADTIEDAQTNPEVRVVLIRGEGDMFTAGNDVSDFAASASGTTGPRNVTRFLKAMAHAEKPLLAAVQGRAVGVGTTLLLHCDYVVLADNALLSVPFVNLALVPEAASSILLPQRIGHARAFAMFALGEAVNAQDALAWGIANQVVPPDELVAAAQTVAAKLARNPLGAVMATKKLMRSAAEISQRMDIEGKEFGARLLSPEAQEAFLAFAQRRAPDFSRF
jgi:enoyl-CoA hydratase/carnithine racemase